jgi:hypothetical protein
MYEMELTFVVAADDLGFITSDSPALVRAPGVDALPIHLRPPPMRWPWTEVMMPVTPSVLAAVSWQLTPLWVNATQDQQDDLNQMLRWHSHHEIVVRRNETRQHWFSDKPKVLR